MARPGLENHRKFKRLQRLLPGECEAHLLGHLEMMWRSGYKDGDPYLGTQSDVELCAGWDGRPGGLFAAMLDAGGDGNKGFVEEVPGRPGHYQIHDLHENAPDYVATRYRVRRWREGKRASDGEVLRNSNVTVTPPSVTVTDCAPLVPPSTEIVRTYVDDVRPSCDHDWTGFNWASVRGPCIETEGRLKVTASQQRDRRLLIAICALIAIGAARHEWLDEAVESFRGNRHNVRKPWAYVQKILVAAAKRDGVELQQLLKSVPVPGKEKPS